MQSGLKGVVTMAKLKLEDLKRIKERVHKDNSLREGGSTAKITVHMGTCGIASGARQGHGGRA